MMRYGIARVGNDFYIQPGESQEEIRKALREKGHRFVSSSSSEEAARNTAARQAKHANGEVKSDSFGA